MVDLGAANQNQKRTKLPGLVTPVPLTITLPAADRPGHADRSLHAYPAWGHIPLPLLLRRGGHPGPGRGTPAGDRAPPRGVDVKPSPERGLGARPGA